jgi:two-component system response regulator DesR
MTSVLLAVEDDPDFQVLIRAALSQEADLQVAEEMPSTVDRAIEITGQVHPQLIILDHNLEGELVGLSAAPRLKEAAPEAKILLFTAYDLGREARAEPAIDAYVRKDDVQNLVPTARRLLGL